MQSHNLQINQPLTMTAGEVADMLGWSRATLLAKLKNLTETGQFPCRLPGGNFSRSQVMIWLDTFGREPDHDIIPLDPALLQRALAERAIDMRRAAR